MRHTTRYLLLLIVGAIAPFFFPGARDRAEQITTTVGAPLVVEALQDDAAPAAIALLRTSQDRYREVQYGETVEPAVMPSVAVPAQGDYALRSGCSLTAEQAEAVLVEYGSPAAGKGIGEASVEFCQRYEIDNGLWLAMFIHESGAGSNERWAGNKGGSYTANTGNIVCAGWPSCYGRFRDYQGDWLLGTEQHFQLLACYRDGGGTDCSGLWSGKSHATVREALNTWAPPFENDTNAYADYVEWQLDTWRAINQGAFVTIGAEGEVETLAPEVIPHFDQDGLLWGTVLPRDGFGVYQPSTIEANVIGSVTQSPGLQTIVIPPGESWSFLGAWTVDVNTLVVEYGVLGASACDLAARIMEVADQMGLQTSHVDHGFALANLPRKYATAIWGTPGVPRSGQDLIITNITDQTAVLKVKLTDDALQYAGYFTGPEETP